MATPISSALLLGAHLLKEIGNEEGSLEDVRSICFLCRLPTGLFLIDKKPASTCSSAFSPSSFN